MNDDGRGGTAVHRVVWSVTIPPFFSIAFFSLKTHLSVPTM